MKEILPGIFHWTQMHPKIRIPVSSYYLLPERVLIDPLIPEEGLDWFDSRPPEHIYLSIRHHYRHCAEFHERFGCAIGCVEQGMHEFTNGEPVSPFKFGDTLAGGLVAVEIGSLCPDESALYLARDGGSVFLADGCVRTGDGPIHFVPDALLGPHPAMVKEGLCKAYADLCDTYEFDNVMFAHGLPWLGGGKEVLRAFIDSPE